MALPGFTADVSDYRPDTSYPSPPTTGPHARSMLTLQDAYYCPPDISTCDCFTWWDCVKCTLGEWPTACKNPFE